MVLDLREGEAPAEPLAKQCSMFLAAQQELRPPDRKAFFLNRVPLGGSPPSPVIVVPKLQPWNEKFISKRCVTDGNTIIRKHHSVQHPAAQRKE